METCRLIQQNCDRIPDAKAEEELIESNQKDALQNLLESRESQRLFDWKSTDLRRRFLFVYFILTNFTTLLCTSVPSPFFARVIIQRGGSTLSSTIILQITSLMTVLSSITFGKTRKYIGLAQLHSAGICCFGACQAGFGMLILINDLNLLVISGGLIRALQGVGQGAVMVSMLTII